MCVIIEKKVGKDIPFASLQLAAERNRDGYGVVVADRGELVTFTGLSEKSTQHAESVAKILEEAKDLPCMVHFRYATAGARSVSNNHPFPLLTKKEDGIDVALMHNGTMQYFKIEGDDLSDTARFVKEIAKPLFQRAWKYADMCEEEMMTDECLANTLKALVGYGVITFMSSSGWTTKVNSFHGLEYDWGWGSNKNNLEPATKDWWKKEEDKDRFLPAVSAWSPPEAWKNRTAEQKVAEDKHLKQLLTTVEEGETVKDLVRLSPHTSSQLPKPSTRLTHTDFIKPYELEDLIYLDLEDIRDMVFKCPEATAIILMDLLHKLYLEGKQTKAPVVNASVEVN